MGKYLTVLSLWIICLFTFAMFATFFSEYLQTSGFFGDTMRSALDSVSNIDDAHSWGARHYWYFWMCILLFLISLIRIFTWSIKYWEDKTF